MHVGVGLLRTDPVWVEAGRAVIFIQDVQPSDNRIRGGRRKVPGLQEAQLILVNLLALRQTRQSSSICCFAAGS